jgi:precorrin-6A/cobalt-precorrin-6A reductase
MAEAAEALGEAAAHVFLTVGRLQLGPFVAKPQHCYLVRTIEPVPPGHGFAQARFI